MGFAFPAGPERRAGSSPPDEWSCACTEPPLLFVKSLLKAVNSAVTACSKLSFSAQTNPL